MRWHVQKCQQNWLLNSITSFVIDDSLLFSALTPLTANRSRPLSAFTEPEIMTFCRITSKSGKWVADVRFYEGGCRHPPTAGDTFPQPLKITLLWGDKGDASPPWIRHTEWTRSLFAFNFNFPINHHLIADVDQLWSSVSFRSTFISSLLSSSSFFFFLIRLHFHLMFPFSPGSSSKVTPLFLSADRLVWYSIL